MEGANKIDGVSCCFYSAELMKEKFRLTFPSGCCSLWSLLMMPRSKSAMLEVKKHNTVRESLISYTGGWPCLIQNGAPRHVLSQRRSRFPSQDSLSSCQIGLCCVFSIIPIKDFRYTDNKRKKPPTILSFQYFHWERKWNCFCWIA